MLVTMTVLRDGYWDGQYPRAGDTITVDPALVQSLEIAGFAMRPVVPVEADRRPPKGQKHGR